jgi:hypothetical protein
MGWTSPRTWAPGEIPTAQDFNTHIRDNFRSVVPVGVVLPFAGLTVPDLFLLCIGTAVSRVGYPALFSQIGTAYGSGDGTTTFNIPDFRGRLAVGMNPGGPTLIDARGDNDGRAQTQRSISHNHTYLRARNVSDASGGAGGVIPFQVNDAVKTTGDVNNNDYPAFLVVQFIIKALD